MDDSYHEFYGKIEETENPIKTSSRPVLETPNGSDTNQRKGLSDGC